LQLQPFPVAFVEEFAPHGSQTMFRPLLYVFAGQGTHLEMSQIQPIVVLHVVWGAILAQ
jgi:hypothetical protein